MGVFRSIANLVRTVATGGRTASMLMEDSGQAMKETKRRILIRLAWLFRKAIFYIGLCSLAIVLLIAAVALVFEIFSMSFYGNDQAMTELNPEDMRAWEESLSDDEIEQMQSHGASIHPSKIALYVEIENESYPKDVKIQIPRYIKTWGDGGSSNTTKYLDYTYKRGETAYPFRQWWQSSASLDAINDTGYKENDVEIVENARDVLKPLFAWEDPETEGYVENSKYDHTSEKEEEVIQTTTVKVTTTGDGSSSTNTSYKEVKTYRPLPFLKNVNTMFADVLFEYKPVTVTDSTTNTSSRTETRTKTVSKTKTRTNEDGTTEQYEVDEEVEYTVTITTVTTVDTEVNSWELIASSKNHHQQFMNFLGVNKIDLNSDPELMYFMAENLPQSYDFTGEYREYLDTMGYMYGIGGGGYGPSGSYTGDFGDFVGGDFTWPVPSNKRITSQYGIRIHPIFKTRKMHTGVDIAAAMGVDIVSTADGTVSYVGWMGGYGMVVMVNHGGGVESLYAHNSRLVATPGQKVSGGDVIAKAGSTGDSTGTHLHFEIRKNGAHTEPLAWLRR